MQIADPGPMTPQQISYSSLHPPDIYNPPELFIIKKEEEGIYSDVATGAIFFVIEHKEDKKNINEIENIAWDFLKKKM